MPSLRMRQISCHLRLLLEPEMGQRPLIFISEHHQDYFIVKNHVINQKGFDVELSPSFTQCQPCGYDMIMTIVVGEGRCWCNSNV